MAIARDKFWMFGVRAHQDDIWLRPGHHGAGATHFYRSRITPAEGAMILNIPNMLMVVCESEPAPFTKEAIGYMESFYKMDKVFWGACRGGKCNRYELEFVNKLAEDYPNVCGVFMDDVSTILRSKKYPEEEKKKMFMETITESKGITNKACRPLENYITWYWEDDPVPGMMDYIDGLSLWTSDYDELPFLPERFDEIERKFKDTNTKFFLGIYMYDFKHRWPYSDEMMEFQCNYGLELLKAGRIEGMIFEANSVMGVKLPSELWLRKWIEKVKYTEIPD